MSHNLNSIKGIIIRVIKGDTRSLDYGSYFSFCYDYASLQELQNLALSTAEMAEEPKVVVEMAGSLLDRCQRCYGFLHLKRLGLVGSVLPVKSGRL